MGRIKEWNEVFEKSIFAEDFFAVMSELYDNELEDVIVRRLYGEKDSAEVHGRGHIWLDGAPEEMAGRVKEGRSEWYKEDEIEEAFENLIRFVPKELEEWERLFDAAWGKADFENYEAGRIDFAAEIKNAETFGERMEKVNCYHLERVDGAEALLVKNGEMRLAGERLKRILDYGADKEKEGRKHEIRVQMVNESKEAEDIDFDEMLEEMTTRLCAMMAKGTDGIYL